eukprot:1656790-Prymnesium_polylepis.3
MFRNARRLLSGPHNGAGVPVRVRSTQDGRRAGECSRCRGRKTPMWHPHRSGLGGQQRNPSQPPHARLFASKRRRTAGPRFACETRTGRSRTRSSAPLGPHHSAQPRRPHATDA